MKTVDEIYQEMLEKFVEKTGYSLTPSGDLAVRLYASAAQISALYTQLEFLRRQSFPQTATGSYLDYHAEMRAIARTAAEKATGVIRFSIDEALTRDVTIAEGTVCMTVAGIEFETTQSAAIAAGSTYTDVPASAVSAGASGNAAAGTVTRMPSAPAYVTQCVNQAAFSGGADAEDDDTLRARIVGSYQHLANGANAEYYRQAALSRAGVAEAYVDARARGIGTVDVYVASSSGVPTQELLDAIETELQAKREIAVDLQVLAPTTQSIDVTAQITVADGADCDSVKAAVEAAVTAYFDGKLLCAPVYIAKLGQIIYGVDGVKNYKITAPAADFAGASAVLPVLGTLTISEA